MGFIWPLIFTAWPMTFLSCPRLQSGREVQQWYFKISIFSSVLGGFFCQCKVSLQVLQCKPIVFHVWMLSLKVCITQGSSISSSKDRRCRFNLGFSVNKGRSSIFSYAHSGTHLSHVNPIHALGASIYNMEAANFA